MSDKEREQRLRIMKLRIIKAERDNLKSPKAYSEMVDKIRKIIMEEATKIQGGARHAD